MMLSRVAEDLFWIGRYVERTENVARLVDVARRMAALPRETGRPLSNEWASVLIAAGATDSIGPGIERADVGTATDHLIFDPSNPSSVLNSIHFARENARANRFSLTRDCWEAINSFWSESLKLTHAQAQGAGLADVIDWVKANAAQFRGTFFGTMVRDDSYYFLRLGMAIERVDSTARLLDVKYHVLLNQEDGLGSSADHYQWLSLLQAAAAHRAYVAMREADISARGVAEFLILEPIFPRAIRFNIHAAREAVENIERFYGTSSVCSQMVSEFSSKVDTLAIDQIIAGGLHEFLTDIIERNYQLANQLSEAYGFAGPETLSPGQTDQ